MKKIILIVFIVFAQQSQLFAKCARLSILSNTIVADNEKCVEEHNQLTGKKAVRRDAFVAISPFVKRRAIARLKDSTCVIINKRFKILKKLEYDFVGEIQDNGLLIVGKNDKEGYINLKGEVIVPVIYDYVDYFYDGMAEINKGRLCGYVNEKGKVVVAPQYSKVDPFKRNNLTMVQSNGKYGFINREGYRAIYPVYDDASDFYKGKSMVTRNNTKYIIDKKENIILSQDYEDISIPSEGLIGVKRNGKWGFIKPNEEVVIPFEYEGDSSDYQFSEGLSIVHKHHKYGFINKKGIVLIPIEYDKVKPFREGLALFDNYSHDKRTIGFLNHQGKVEFSFSRDSIYEMRSFYNGLASIQKNYGGKYGFINKKGKIIIKPQFSYAGDFTNKDYAVVEESGKWGVINRKGEVVVPIVYDSCRSVYSGLIPVKKNGKWGYSDMKGNIVIPFIYDAAFSFHIGEVAIVVKDRVIYEIDKKGTILTMREKISKRVWKKMNSGVSFYID